MSLIKLTWHVVGIVQVVLTSLRHLMPLSANNGPLSVIGAKLLPPEIKLNVNASLLGTSLGHQFKHQLSQEYA